MYNYSHSKRILPRKDEPYRTEIPNQFYSSSSLYSYTPTSSSDCPEHGRSHRRATIILTFCVVFGTLGVLSIAGVAAYLGMISRSLHNASQIEESFLLSKHNNYDDISRNNFNSHLNNLNSNNNNNNNNNFLIIDEDDAEPTTTTASLPYDPSLIVTASSNSHHHQYHNNVNNGRRRVSNVNYRQQLQQYEDEEIAAGNHRYNHQHVVDQVDLTNSLNTEPSSPAASKTTASTPSTKPIIPNLITKKPVIATTSVPSLRPRPPIISLNSGGEESIRKPTAQSPPISLIDKPEKKIVTVSSSISESQPNSEDQPTTKKVPSSNQQNHHQFNLNPLNNNANGINLSELNNRPLVNYPMLSQSVHPAQFTQQTRIKGEISHQPLRNSSGFRPVNVIATVIPTTTEKYLSNNNEFANRQGQVVVIPQTESDDDRYFQPIAVTTTTTKPNSKPIVQSSHHQTHREGFIPSKPILFHKPNTNGDNNEEGGSNPGQNDHLTFDRISPEFYDEKPWTPLILRPSNLPIQLDKRPRIEVSTTTTEQIIPSSGPAVRPQTFVPSSINHADANILPPQSKEMYYNYDDKKPNVLVVPNEEVNLSNNNNNGAASSQLNNNLQVNSNSNNIKRVGQVLEDKSYEVLNNGQVLTSEIVVSMAPSSTSTSSSPSLSKNTTSIPNINPVSDHQNNKDVIVSSSSTDDEIREDVIKSDEHDESSYSEENGPADVTTIPTTTTKTTSSTASSSSSVQSSSDEEVGFTSPSGADADASVENDEDIIKGPIQIPAYTVLIPHIPNPKPDTDDKPNFEVHNVNNEHELHNNGSEEEQETESENVTIVDRDENNEQNETTFANEEIIEEKSELSNNGGASKTESLIKESGPERTELGSSHSQGEVLDDDYIPEEEEGDYEKDNDYVDAEEEKEQSPQRIYKLDVPPQPIILDIIPERERPLSKIVHHNTKSDLELDVELHSGLFPSSGGSDNAQRPKASKKDDMQSTTDYILSTLGNLNLVKALTPSDSDLPSSSDEQLYSFSGSEEPLFPPIRSYVGINQPLRPKPSELDEAEADANQDEKIILLTDSNFLVGQDGGPLLKKVRFSTSDDESSATSTLNKVLSMMMKVEPADIIPTAGSSTKNSPSKNENSTEPIAHNVHLLVATTAPTNGTSSSGSSSREQKSIHRDPKIDSRFHDEIEQIPVPLIIAAASASATTDGNSQPTRQIRISTKYNSNNNNSTGNNSKWNPIKPSSITINANSPVYKFVLRRGQSVEDLLKEIFQNYTEKGVGQTLTQTGLPTANLIPATRPEPGTVNIQFTSDPNTASNAIPDGGGVSSNNKANNSTISTIDNALSSPPSILTTTTTTLTPILHTSTSIIVNEIEEQQLQLNDCPSNSSFRCASNGECISNFARCNGVRECKDGSDEKHCTCVEYLKAQMLHRKICDGVPDCKDLTDEFEQCEWCKPGQYICAGSRVCIPRDKICDSRRDCPRGDDESDCVKIGQSSDSDRQEEMEDLAPVYHRSGHLMVRKKGVWGKLCVETFSTVLSHWEIKDLARAVCKAKTFSDFESVERVEDEEYNNAEPYYELYDGANETDTTYSSSESTPRTTIGFKVSPCKTRLVVKVTCQDLQCGTAPRAFTQAARIVGGSNAFPGEWPWQAALYRDGEYQCGATLISSRWLLSAGHCFYHAQDDYWVARLGTLRRGATVLSPYEQVIRITHVFLHPQYKDVGFVNDVSLLRLEHEVNFTDFVRPVCLPSKDTSIRDGRMCTVVGWGQLYEVGRVFPDTLQEVQLPLISTSECRKRTLFLPLYKLTDQMFCAGFDRGGRDACLGDSGGPLMCSEGDGKWSLYGVTSNGYGCARANRPGVYTKVASYLDWIYDKMSQDNTFAYRDKAKPCAGYRCQLGECIDEKRICNGFSDCDSGEDERNCTWS